MVTYIIRTYILVFTTCPFVRCVYTTNIYNKIRWIYEQSRLQNDAVLSASKVWLDDTSIYIYVTIYLPYMLPYIYHYLHILTSDFQLHGFWGGKRIHRAVGLMALCVGPSPRSEDTSGAIILWNVGGFSLKKTSHRGKRTTTNNQQPTTNNHQPPQQQQQPQRQRQQQRRRRRRRRRRRQPTTNNQQPTTNNQQPTTNNHNNNNNNNSSNSNNNNNSWQIISIRLFKMYL